MEKKLNRSWSKKADLKLHGHISLKVPNLKFDFNVSVKNFLLSTHTSESNLTLGTHLLGMIRTQHFDFDVRFRPTVCTLLSKTLHQSQIRCWVFSVIHAYISRFKDATRALEMNIVGSRRRNIP